MPEAAAVAAADAPATRLTRRKYTPGFYWFSSKLKTNKTPV
jgi:hypothetical protein